MISEAVAAQAVKAGAHLRSWRMEGDERSKRVKPTNEKSEEAPRATHSPAVAKTSLYDVEWIDVSVLYLTSCSDNIKHFNKIIRVGAVTAAAQYVTELHSTG